MSGQAAERCWLAGLLAACIGCGPPNATQSHVVVSEINQESYLLKVLAPPERSEPLPVVWLLDEYSHFNSLARFAAAGWQNKKLKPFLLVGVGYSGLDFSSIEKANRISEKRNRDLTFPDYSYAGAPTGPSQGRADLFHRVLVEELIPFIELSHSVDVRSRMLLGHSLAGLFCTLEALQFGVGTPRFATIAAASPSYWWADGSIFDREAELAKTATDLPLRLYLGAGTLEGAGMMSGVQTMSDLLVSRNYPRLKVSTHTTAAAHMQAAQNVLEEVMQEHFQR